MVIAVIRQLDFQSLEFDVVLSGSMFEGGPLLIEPLRATVLSEAPGARFVRLDVPPVIGSVMIGMEQGGLKPDHAIRDRLAKTLPALREAAAITTILQIEPLPGELSHAPCSDPVADRDHHVERLRAYAGNSYYGG